MNARTLVSILIAVVGLLGPAAQPALAQERRASISGTVWFDANVNGKPDSQERAVKNLQIDLEGPNYRESRKTNDNGTYEFNNLGPGKFQLTIRIPTGYGLSAGDNKEITLDGRTAVRQVDFGVARADQLPTPTATPTPTVLASETPAILIAPAQPPAAPPPPAPPSGGAPSGGLQGGSNPAPAPPINPLSSGGRNWAPPAAPPTSTPEPTATSTPEPTATPAPTSTPVPSATATATRTPPPVEGQQALAERARASASEPQAPRLESVRTADEVLLDVPFRSALDGSEYADTNSGSAAVGMSLESYGYMVPTEELRALANTLNRSYDVGQPPRIQDLVRVSEHLGVRGVGLFQGIRLAVWSADDIREKLRAGYPVLTMILPGDAAGEGELGRERFILIIGFKGGNFVYHDPAYADQRGANRTISPNNLTKAWANGPAPAQAAGLALGPDHLGLFAPLADLTRAQQQQPSDRPEPIREVPTVAPQPALGGPLGALIPVPPSSEVAAGAAVDSTSRSSGGFPVHPLLLAFWAVAGVIFLKVLAGLVFD